MQSEILRCATNQDVLLLATLRRKFKSVFQNVFDPIVHSCSAENLEGDTDVKKFWSIWYLSAFFWREFVSWDYLGAIIITNKFIVLLLIAFYLTDMDKKVEIQIEANRPKLNNRKGIRVENYSKPARKKINSGKINWNKLRVGMFGIY